MEEWRRLEAALARAPEAPADLRAVALHLTVFMAAVLGDPEAMMDGAQLALAAAQELGDPFAIGRAYYNLGAAWARFGDSRQAEVAYRTASSWMRTAGVTWWQATALGEAGDERHLAGDVAGAVPVLDEALALS